MGQYLLSDSSEGKKYRLSMQLPDPDVCFPRQCSTQAVSNFKVILMYYCEEKYETNIHSGLHYNYQNRKSWV